MTIACSCHNSCPEVPDITVTQTVLQFDGTTSYFRDEYFDGPGTNFTLAYQPYSAASVQVALNSGVQRQGIDFNVLGAVIKMTSALVAGDKLHVMYFSADGTTAVTDFKTGMIVGYQGTAVPDGWLELDGVTSYTIADYVALHTYAVAQGLVLSATATEFVLKQVQVPLYDTALAVTVLAPGIIKT